MKIDGSQFADDLLQRMQEAHEQQKTSTVSGTDTQKTFSVEQLAATREPEAVGEVAASGLETQLRATAEKALRGEFPDSAAVREAVVEDVLRDRWEAKVGRSQVEKMIRTLKPTLVDDPEFARQVDEMLIMAARSVGTSR
jgi:hypothetical protein